VRITITPTDNPKDFTRVSPDFIYNRFDLFCHGDFFAVKLCCSASEKVIEYLINGDRAELGIWLTDITAEELEHLIIYIARTHSGVKQISYTNGVISCGKAKQHNHFRVEFPDTAEEFKARVSPKSWSKMRRRNRRAEEIYGPLSLEEYSGGNIPLDIVETFFQYKLATHNRVYNMTAAEYLERYHVSDCYVVRFGETIGALHFCCEQCPVVYGENHAYNPDMTEYSLGKFIFAHSLLRIAQKEKHTQIYLAGGDYEYKTHYGSIEETLYDCVIELSEKYIADLESKHSASKKFKRRIASLLPKRVGDWLYRIKVKLFG